MTEQFQAAWSATGVNPDPPEPHQRQPWNHCLSIVSVCLLSGGGLYQITFRGSTSILYTGFLKAWCSDHFPFPSTSVFLVLFTWFGLPQICRWHRSSSDIQMAICKPACLTNSLEGCQIKLNLSKTQISLSLEMHSHTLILPSPKFFTSGLNYCNSYLTGLPWLKTYFFNKCFKKHKLCRGWHSDPKGTITRVPGLTLS